MILFHQFKIVQIVYIESLISKFCFTSRRVSAQFFTLIVCILFSFVIFSMWKSHISLLKNGYFLFILGDARAKIFIKRKLRQFERMRATIILKYYEQSIRIDLLPYPIRCFYCILFVIQKKNLSILNISSSIFSLLHHCVILYCF